ncbi:hypothetical protein [Rhodanobacter sp. 7MK24]|uniref:hypothetical protein n=1 Tax=Rhodanobacter sp. 7MK24 TaxID=2775922 RepID=UPI001CE0F71E|nr:hypothetical protein [Rhodanobacter sp. 7MK24]
MPQRIQRATGIILLDISAPLSLFRYLARCLSGHARVGALEGGRDRVTWNMLHHIAVVTPGNRKRYAEIFRRIALPKIRLASIGAIDGFYQQSSLERQATARSGR